MLPVNTHTWWRGVGSGREGWVRRDERERERDGEREMERERWRERRGEREGGRWREGESERVRERKGRYAHNSMGCTILLREEEDTMWRREEGVILRGRCNIERRRATLSKHMLTAHCTLKIHAHCTLTWSSETRVMLVTGLMLHTHTGKIND
jgi:hypothetical protein